jgi:hypothetical protein
MIEKEVVKEGNGKLSYNVRGWGPIKTKIFYARKRSKLTGRMRLWEKKRRAEGWIK